MKSGALEEAERKHGTSLGLVAPARIVRVFAKRRTQQERDEWLRHREIAMANRDLFVDVDSKTKDLVLPGVQYRVEFVCRDERCTTIHNMGILDWGTYQLSRKQCAVRGPAQAERDVILKLEQYLNVEKKNVHFFLGNSLPHPQSFMVVGMFYPPRAVEKSIAPSAQLSLL